MFTQELTIFDLAETTTHLVAVGGGGNPEYGKSNGILVIPKASVESGQPFYYYKTKDIIQKVALSEDKTTSQEEIEEDEFSEVDNNSTKSIKMLTKACSISSLKEDSFLTKESPLDKEEKSFYIAAAGLSFFYILRYRKKKLKLLKRIRATVEGIYFTSNLILLHDGSLSGFYDVINNIKDLKIEAPTTAVSDTYEEYFYKLFRKGSRIIYKREGGTQDIPNDWSNFYVYNRSVYKVIYKNGSSNFVFNNKRYTYEGEIPKIAVSGNNLIAYTTSQETSLLIFIIEGKEAVYELPRITCMTINGSYAAVGTYKGDIILYDQGYFKSKTFASPIPITGLVINGTTAYFSTLTGSVEKISVSPGRKTLWFLAALLILVLAASIKYWKDR